MKCYLNQSLDNQVSIFLFFASDGRMNNVIIWMLNRNPFCKCITLKWKSLIVQTTRVLLFLYPKNTCTASFFLVFKHNGFCPDCDCCAEWKCPMASTHTKPWCLPKSDGWSMKKNLKWYVCTTCCWSFQLLFFVFFCEKGNSSQITTLRSVQGQRRTMDHVDRNGRAWITHEQKNDTSTSRHTTRFVSYLLMLVVFFFAHAHTNTVNVREASKSLPSSSVPSVRSVANNSKHPPSSSSSRATSKPNTPPPTVNGFTLPAVLPLHAIHTANRRFSVRVRVTNKSDLRTCWVFWFLRFTSFFFWIRRMEQQQRQRQTVQFWYFGHRQYTNASDWYFSLFVCTPRLTCVILDKWCGCVCVCMQITQDFTKQQ